MTERAPRAERRAPPAEGRTAPLAERDIRTTLAAFTERGHAEAVRIARATGRPLPAEPRREPRLAPVDAPAGSAAPQRPPSTPPVRESRTPGPPAERRGRLFPGALLGVVRAAYRRFGVLPLALGVALTLVAGGGVVWAMQRTPPAASQLGAAIGERGKVQVAVNFPGAAGIVSAGLLHVGDRIDLVATLPTNGRGGKQVATVVRNVRIAGPGAAGTPLKAPVFLFEVTPQEANEIEFLATLPVDAVLRVAGDDADNQPKPVDFQYMAEKYGLLGGGTR